MYGSSWDWGHFVKNFCFDTICNINTEITRSTNTEIQLCMWVHWQVCCDETSITAKNQYINRNLCFDHLAIPPQLQFKSKNIMDINIIIGWLKTYFRFRLKKFFPKRWTWLNLNFVLDFFPRRRTWLNPNLNSTCIEPISTKPGDDFISTVQT